jgi:hypothetical protein
MAQNSGCMDARMTGHQGEMIELITLGKSDTQTSQLFNFETPKPEPVFLSCGQLLENVAILYGAALLGIKDTPNIFITYRSVWVDITHPGSIRRNRFKYFFVDSGLNAFDVHQYLLSIMVLNYNCNLLRSAISLQTTSLPNLRFF